MKKILHSSKKFSTKNLIGIENLKSELKSHSETVLNLRYRGNETYHRN